MGRERAAFGLFGPDGSSFGTVLCTCVVQRLQVQRNSLRRPRADSSSDSSPSSPRQLLWAGRRTPSPRHVTGQIRRASQSPNPRQPQGADEGKPKPRGRKKGVDAPAVFLPWVTTPAPVKALSPAPSLAPETGEREAKPSGFLGWMPPDTARPSPPKPAGEPRRQRRSRLFFHEGPTLATSVTHPEVAAVPRAGMFSLPQSAEPRRIVAPRRDVSSSDEVSAADSD